MIKGKELLGRPVVAVSNGAQVDNVHDVVFDHQGNRVLALLVEEGGWFSAGKAVPFERVQSIGEKAVMIATPEDVVNTRRDPVLKEALAGKTNLIGMTLLTTDGQTLGKITDVYFDERSGQVEGYEASGGLFADMTNGRTFIPAPQTIQIGKDSAIVPADVAAAMREQAPGGIRGAFHAAGQSLSGVGQGLTGAVQGAADSVRGAYEDTSRSVRDTYENVTENVQDAAREGQAQARAAVDTLRTRVQEEAEDLRDASAERQRAFVVGKVAGEDVRTESGVLIVAKGTPIDEGQARFAEQSGALPALVAAATAGGVQEGVRGLLADPQSASGDVVGRRVQEDVRSSVGSLIAVQGQIVTPAVAQRARELGLEERLYAATRTGGVAAGVGGAALPDPAELREQATELRDQLAEGLSSVSQNVSQGAGELLGRAKSWLGEKREDLEETLDRQEQEAHHARVRDALGRPVTRAVLTRTDRVILQPGELVTHAALDEARAAGVLDLLLDSVDTASLDSGARLS
ncbi:PRC-barrel domain-containing protein [Deinococcus wulumuqiensis]|uniref:PRC-barrel domain-containing protein n=1 Tax=Deinococcus wulumuqiensis TaxID=980427 RepID=A0AAV4K085_9DEIO|nr:PRC-barrel domain-containing protein [Deinococcus wulumuqiensis]QII20641.1 hypothetical protein G6R31_07610 [Deinococcus wulumuqiensis R12]GGI73007.1 hypothetical protein GCM10010914_03770 [Deinococcus wulumuqiensis]GGP28601.1 hypothetical protein GCM10008021_02520 [Deinococcus wulumuqiensis]